jgi:hypothetical protein
VRVALVTLGLVLVSSTAAAQPAAAPPPDSVGQADALAAEAEGLAQGGDFLGAAAKFRAAHAADPRPSFLCNVGVAFYKAKDLPRAQLYLGRCLTRAGSLEAVFVASVRTVFASVEDKLRADSYAPVDVTVKPDTAAFSVSTFSPEDEIVGAGLLWLPLGTHTITARADGHRDGTATVEVKDKTHQNVRVTLEPAPAGGDGDGDGDGNGTGPVVATGPRRSKTPAIIATAGTLVFGGGALYAFLTARSKAEDAGAPMLSDDEYDRRVDKARRWQKISWALGGVAVVGAVASGYLWYKATRSTTTSVEVAPTADGGASVTFSGAF